MAEDRLQELRDELGTGLVAPAIVRVLVEVPNLLERPCGIVAPDGIFLQALAEKVIGKEPAVLKELAGEDGIVKDDAKLVELVEGILVRPGKLPEGPHILGARLPAIDAENPGDDLNLEATSGTGLLFGPFVEQDELERVERRGEDDKVVFVAFPQDADQLVANFGGE